MKIDQARLEEMKAEFSRTVRGFMPADTILAGVELGVFELLAKKPLTVPETVKALKLNKRGGEILLNALAAIGYLQKKKDKLSLTPISETFLVPGGPNYMGNAARHQINVKKAWEGLAGAAKTGKPTPRPTPKNDAEIEKRQRAFILAMSDFSAGAADKVAAAIDLSAVKEILDVGGGPGTYSFAMIRRKPDIKVCIFDLPQTIAITRECIAQHKLEHAVGTIEGDLLTDDLGYEFDLVLVSSIIHIFSPAQNKKLIKKCFNSLNPGGRLMIKDWFMEDSKTAPVPGALFAINMLVNTDHGNTYTQKEVSEWMTEAGFDEPTRLDVTPDNALLIAGKPEKKKNK